MWNGGLYLEFYYTLMRFHFFRKCRIYYRAPDILFVENNYQMTKEN